MDWDRLERASIIDELLQSIAEIILEIINTPEYGLPASSFNVVQLVANSLMHLGDSRIPEIQKNEFEECDHRSNSIPFKNHRPVIDWHFFRAAEWLENGFAAESHRKILSRRELRMLVESC